MKLCSAGAKIKNLIVLDADLTTSVMAHLFEQKFPIGIILGFRNRIWWILRQVSRSQGNCRVACSFAVFLTGIGWQQIRNAICYPNLNVKLVGSHVGIQVGEDGATHQALEDIAIMRVIPNMKVFVPLMLLKLKKCYQKFWKITVRHIFV